MATVRRLFKITDMHCSSCALDIDMDLEELDGVKMARTSYAKAETEVEYDAKKVSDKLILETIKQSGYHAESVARLTNDL